VTLARIMRLVLEVIGARRPAGSALGAGHTGSVATGATPPKMD
jgi:hypothetical protein